MAARLGYPDDGTALPVERFMGDYYRHARAIRTLSEIVRVSSATSASRA